MRETERGERKTDKKKKRAMTESETRRHRNRLRQGQRYKNISIRSFKKLLGN